MLRSELLQRRWFHFAQTALRANDRLHYIQFVNPNNGKIKQVPIHMQCNPTPCVVNWRKYIYIYRPVFRDDHVRQNEWRWNHWMLTCCFTKDSTDQSMFLTARCWKSLRLLTLEHVLMGKIMGTQVNTSTHGHLKIVCKVSKWVGHQDFLPERLSYQLSRLPSICTMFMKTLRYKLWLNVKKLSLITVRGVDCQLHPKQTINWG